MSSPNNKYLECLITLQGSLINMLKNKGRKTSLWGPQKDFER